MDTKIFIHLFAFLSNTYTFFPSFFTFYPKKIHTHIFSLHTFSPDFLPSLFLFSHKQMNTQKHIHTYIINTINFYCWSFDEWAPSNTAIRPSLFPSSPLLLHRWLTRGDCRRVPAKQRHCRHCHFSFSPLPAASSELATSKRVSNGKWRTQLI